MIRKNCFLFLLVVLMILSLGTGIVRESGPALWAFGGLLVANLVVFLWQHGGLAEVNFQIFGHGAEAKRAPPPTDIPELPASAAGAVGLAAHTTASGADVPRPGIVAHMGELLWYLSSPEGRNVDSVSSVMGRFVSLLDQYRLPETRRQAVTLQNRILQYNMRTGLITSATAASLMAAMVPIQQALYQEFDTMFVVNRRV